MSFFILVQLGIVLGYANEIPALWLLFGFFGTIGILMYAVLSQHFAKEIAGRVNTTINLMVFVSIFALQSLSGAIINLWTQSSNGAYPAGAYQSAFMMFLVLQVLALLWYFYSWHRQYKRQEL